MERAVPLEQLYEIGHARRNVRMGLPAPVAARDRRFALTPEGVSLLVDDGYQVLVERGAGETIHYDDAAYAACGAKIVSREEVFTADVVIDIAPLQVADARLLKRGAMVMTMLSPDRQDPMALKVMLEKRVTAIAIDLIADNNAHTPFRDIIDEIEGRAAITLAAAELSDMTVGKGILLGGITGVNPCEVVILGSGIPAISAARAAVGLGATVRIFDNDIYSLRAAGESVGPGTTGSCLQPRVIASALATADVVIATPMTTRFAVSYGVVDMMKKGVLIFDRSDGAAPVFPSLQHVDLSSAHVIPLTGQRVAYTNASGAVARTTAMALSNTFIAMLAEIMTCDGPVNSLKLKPGIRRAVYTFMGRPTHCMVTALTGVRYIDIDLMLQFS